MSNVLIKNESCNLNAIRLFLIRGPYKDNKHFGETMDQEPVQTALLRHCRATHGFAVRRGFIPLTKISDINARLAGLSVDQAGPL